MSARMSPGRRASVRVLVGLLGLALLGLGVLAWWNAERTARGERAGAVPVRAPDAPMLRSARGALARPTGLRLRVHTSGAPVPPAGLLVFLTTPHALRAERTAPFERGFGHADFVGDTLAIDDLRYRIWDLTLLAPGHVGLRRQFALPATPGPTPHELHVTLDAWAGLTVRVLDADGVPVPEARIALDGAGVDGRDHPAHPEDRPILVAQAAVRTDRSGHADLPALRPGVRTKLRVRHPHHPVSTEERTLPPAGIQEEHVVTLAAPSGIRGTVDLAAFGTTAAAVVVTDFHHAERTATFQRRARIEEDGRFFLRNVPPGTHTVQVTARRPGTASSALREVDVPRGRMVDMGRVVPDGGAPLRLRLHVEQPHAADARVRFHLTRFPPETAGLAQGALDRHPLEFVLPPGADVTLHGLGEGTLVVAAALTDPRGAPLTTHRTAKAAVLPDGRGETLELVIRQVVPAPPTRDVRVTLRPPLRVMPRDFRWRVFLFDEEDRLVGSTMRRPAAGAHRFHMLVPERDGPLRVVAVAHGRVSAWASLDELPPRGAAVALESWAGDAARVVASVRDERGRPVVGATVLVRLGADEAARTAMAVTTDASGHAVFDTLPGRALYLRVEGDARGDVDPVALRADALTAGRATEVALLVHREP